MIEEWQYELKLGNEKALQRVFSEYYTTLCSIVFQYVKDNQISESIAEDVIFNLWEKRELQQLIDKKLKDLSPQCQRVFYLSRYENLSYHEISLQLGISENTVKYHIKTALAYLRKELSPYILSLLVAVLSAE